MQPLEKTLRKQLENTIKAARDIAEAAARAALEQLGVGDATPFSHLSDAERELRRNLRVHGRQLGDTFLPSPSGRGAGGEGRFQTLERLTEEVAYEHWHRMLFARFLAENNLLMYPDPDEPVAVTLEECDDLAADEGAANGWELAARFAADMLPQIFRLDSPVFQLALPPEHQQKLERLVTDLSLETFTASDSLGWVYQFWQANNKERINKSELKIGARELPAVTQLFTEPYMVSFLLDNSLGAWWAARRLSESDLQLAASEAELRQKAAIPGVPLEYLRFVQIPLNPPLTKGDLLDAASVAKSDLQDDSDQSPPLQKEGQGGFTWQPAAGTFDLWPKQLSELKTLDPCCGSGHFLVAAFLMLVPMRMALEDLTARDAVDRVLSENLHGLELDQRCVELAAFALALTAWRYPDAGGYRPLPELHIACSGLSVSVAKEEWKQLGLGKKNLTIALDWLHDTFKDAPVLGSLLNPAKTQAANLVQWDELSQTLNQALKMLPSPSGRGAGGEGSDEQHEIGVVAQGLAKAATLLAGQYQWVITNVPYLARGKQDERLRDFCEQHYPAAKNDLATVFLDRCLQLCMQGGTASIVLPQNWLFLTTYKKFREQLLTNDTWHLIARLGPGAFETISGEVVKAILITLSRGNPADQHDGLFIGTRHDHLIHGFDVSEPHTASEKALNLVNTHAISVGQLAQLANPDNTIVLSESTEHNLLKDSADGLAGILNGDSPRFQRQFWEFFNKGKYFVYQQGTVIKTAHFGGLEKVIEYDDVNGHIRLPADFRRERLHDSDQRGNSAWGKWGIAVSEMNVLPSALYIGNKYDSNIGVILPKVKNILPALWCYCSSRDYNSDVRCIDQKLNVTNATLVKVPFDEDYWTKIAEIQYPNGLPKPYSVDPTQWIFHGHPCGSVIWNDESKWTAHGSLRTDDTVLQVAVARLLGYRWPAELDAIMELAEQQREWVNRCEALLPCADEDGIVCLPPVRGEAAAADRLLNLLAAAYGDAWSNDSLAQVLNSADHAGKTLETWLREKFFTQHCKLFQHRPFIWHIWDGLRDGFSALVNYHKFDTKLLETLIYTYLGDWISRQKQDIANGIDGAEEKLAAAENLKKKLELILVGEAPYDIFVRWKPLSQQAIGWNPDLNDGVRLNIRPFLSVPDVGKRGAGILRDKPNIKWEKDRGKDVESAPWYHLFNGDRINDHHLSLAEKRQARDSS
ncbi:MAG: N-6 DNA methylase [Methylicorpusculum sp.]|uniref:Eco57I restriction-modification methylase domain-containing protein n=1 Tax=Methylicorpusculum sp. TaxID=2713644 RepID=UPI00272FEEB3|nr:N-6 DNA methylase [Methylicorpusculum sp.]MDP2203753.1 N-6 DNA methylase [Methylicorpusculum sp.]